MKVVVSGELRCVTCRGEFKRKDGTVDYNCSLLLENDGASYNLPCKKKVFDMFDKGMICKGDDISFIADYFPQFKFNQFVVVDLA